MSFDLSIGATAFLAICAMTAATLATRFGGYWLIGFLRLSPAMRRGLDALPGAVIIAIVTPVALDGGVAATVCIVVTLALMATVKKDFVAVAGGVVAGLTLRLGFGL